MLNKVLKGNVVRIIALLLTLSILLSSFVSCKLFVYVADDKGEIQANIAESVASGEKNNRVSEYLRDWGLPVFDKVKFEYFEVCVTQLYNLEGGIPETLTHAAETANLFLEKYYDTIDLDDKTAVTDSLLSCYVSAIGDPYSVYRPPVETEEYNTDMSGKFGGIGVVVEYDHVNETIMVNSVYQNSPAAGAGIQVGDFIYAVNGVTIEEIGYDKAVNHIRGELGTSVELTVLRGSEKITVSMIRAEFEEIIVDFSFDEETKIGYIRIASFKENTFDQFKEAIDELENLGAVGIIFDLRSNPGGYVNSVCDVVSYLLPTGEAIISYQYKNRDPVYRYTEDDRNEKNKAFDHTVDLPMVILCNQYTASSGEIFTSAMRDYRNDGKINATIVGTTTYKKGIMQNTYYYLDESSVTLTVAYYNPPCGENYHGIGITPDVIVENSSTEDLQLDAAYEEMQKLLQKEN